MRFTKPGVPLATAVNNAEKLLEQSKELGRDRLTLFGSTLPWSQFEDLFYYADFFDREVKRKKAGPGEDQKQIITHRRWLPALPDCCRRRGSRVPSASAKGFLC